MFQKCNNGGLQLCMEGCNVYGEHQGEKVEGSNSSHHQCLPVALPNHEPQMDATHLYLYMVLWSHWFHFLPCHSADSIMSPSYKIRGVRLCPSDISHCGISLTLSPCLQSMIPYCTSHQFAFPIIVESKCRFSYLVVRPDTLGVSQYSRDIYPEKYNSPSIEPCGVNAQGQVAPFPEVGIPGIFILDDVQPSKHLT